MPEHRKVYIPNLGQVIHSWRDQHRFPELAMLVIRPGANSDPNKMVEQGECYGRRIYPELDWIFHQRGVVVAADDELGRQALKAFVPEPFRPPPPSYLAQGR